MRAGPHHDPVTGALTLPNGVRVLASDLLPTDTVEDWSRVRSPSRAARRRRQGHRQAITYRQEPRREVYFVEVLQTFFMHPVVLAQFKVALERRAMTDEFWATVRDALREIGCFQAANTVRGLR